MITTPYERWMVGLDLTDMDTTIVKWVNYLSQVMKPQCIYFIHVEKHFEIPTYVPDDVSKSLQVTDEAQKEAINELLAEHFDNDQVEIHVEVIEGKPFDTLMRWVDVKKIDFFIAGRKDDSKGHGVLPHKLSRKIHSPILFIPEKDVAEVKKVLVPVDFSEHSLLALSTAIKFSDLVDGCEVVCMHVYNVPTGYYKTGKSYADFAELMKYNAIEHFHKFIRPLGRDIRYTSALLEKAPAHDIILNEVRDGDYDMVMLGSKGQTVGSFILLGSTAEKLIQINNHGLTWVVKKKDENLSFFQALKKI